MIVVAIIGILASVAIPAYQDYITRAQVTEAVYLVQSGKTPFGEFYSDRGVWPSAASDVMGTISGKYVSEISITVGAGNTGTVTLQAKMKGLGSVNTNLVDQTLTMTSSNGKLWDCRGGSILPKYRPSACR